MLLFAFCLLVTYTSYSAQTIAGDQTTGNSFSFKIQANAYSRASGLFFVGAHEVPTGSGIDYSIALAGPEVTSFSPMTASPTATINDAVNQMNPLRGARIDFLSLLGTKPVAIKNGEPSSIYIVQESNPSKYSLLKAANILDANGALVTTVAALATNGPENEDAVLQGGMAAFTAVAPSGGDFGEPGGGIAVATLTQITENEITKLSFNYLATTELTTTTQAVRIGGNLAAMGPFVTLYTSSLPQSKIFWTYIGLQVQAGTGGAYGVIVMPATAQKPVFYDLAPATAVEEDSIIATNSPSAQVSIYHVGTMLTTTQLPYLVVVGGVYTPPAGKNKVYALPQLSTSPDLASKNAIPQTTFSPDYPFLIQSRAFVTPATAAGDLYTPADIPAVVGGGDAPGDITDLFVSGDAVFVAVPVSNASQPSPGIFHSQALFDDLGRIKGWTKWQRVGATNSMVQLFAFDERSGNFWYLPGADEDNLFTVLRTQWVQAGGGISGLTNGIFASVTGGVQGNFDFPSTTVGFDASPAARIALTMMTGYQQVLIVQTGMTVANSFTPVNDFTNGFISKDGTLAGFVSGVRWLSCSGGVLNDLGAIIAATVVSDGTQAWFVVAGSGGVAVLAHDDGTGSTTEMQSGFIGLDASMKWHKIGAYSNVRKLIAQSLPLPPHLYVLTNNKFDRLVANATTFSGNTQPITLAQPDGLPGGQNKWFADAIVTSKLALLTTSSGFLRSANNIDITTVSAEAMSWVAVPLAESVGPVTRLFAVTVDGTEGSLAGTPASSGNLYVLNAYVGYHQARVYRFTVRYAGNVDDSTLVQLPDYVVKDKKTFFLSIGDYRNYITTDGSVFATSRSRYIDSPLFEELLGPTWKRVALTVQASRPMLDNAVRVVTTKSKSIGHMVRSSGLGAWLVPGDFGLFVNE